MSALGIVTTAPGGDIRALVSTLWRQMEAIQDEMAAAAKQGER